MQTCISPGYRESVQRIACAAPPDLLNGVAMHTQGDENQKDRDFFHGVLFFQTKIELLMDHIFRVIESF